MPESHIHSRIGLRRPRLRLLRERSDKIVVKCPVALGHRDARIQVDAPSLDENVTRR